MNEQKILVAEAIAQRVKDGETIGVGSGSTSWLAIEKIGERVRKEGLHVSAVTAAHASAFLAESYGISVLSLISTRRADWGFDGADEVDPHLNLIKGAWGAMLNEKIVAARCNHFVIIVSEDKLVKRLGERFAIPVEVVPEAAFIAQEELKKIGAVAVTMRKDEKKGSPFNTEHNNFVLDAKFEQIDDSLEDRINAVVGVVDNGLFINRANEVLVAKESGVFSLTYANGKLSETLVIGR